MAMNVAAPRNAGQHPRSLASLRFLRKVVSSVAEGCPVCRLSGCIASKLGLKQCVVDSSKRNGRVEATYGKIQSSSTDRSWVIAGHDGPEMRRLGFPYSKRAVATMA